MSDGALFPFVFRLSSQLCQGKPANPILKEFLRAFPPSADWDVNAPTRTSTAFDFDDLKDLEAPLLVDESTAQIKAALSRRASSFADSLYDPVGDYPAKPTAPRPRKSASILESDQMRQRRMVDERWQIRKNYLATRPTPSELQETEHEHQKFVQKIFPNRTKTLAAPPRDIARESRDRRMEAGERVRRENKKLLAKAAQTGAVDDVPDAKAIPKVAPFAADLNDWARRMTIEVRELTALRNRMEVESAAPINSLELKNRLTQAEPADASEVRPDYHMQFAMLFQKLENTEQKIQELDEACARFQ
jgi:hypothetical protein